VLSRKVNGEIPQASIATRFAMAAFLLNTSRPGVNVAIVLAGVMWTWWCDEQT